MMGIHVFRARGVSMEPSIHDGDYIIVSNLRTRLSEGDLVALRHPASRIPIVKRVSRLNEATAYVLGDNASASDDSRAFGDVDRSLIIGKVLAVI